MANLKDFTLEEMLEEIRARQEVFSLEIVPLNDRDHAWYPIAVNITQDHALRIGAVLDSLSLGFKIRLLNGDTEPIGSWGSEDGDDSWREI